MNGFSEDSHWDDSLYQLLLNAIPSSVLLISRDMRIAWTNRNFLEKSRSSANETINRRLQDVLPTVILDSTGMVQRIQRVFDTNESTSGEKVSFRAPGGLMRIYYYRVLPLSARSNAEFVILLMEDVTEQARLVENIRRMERHLAIVVESTSEIILSTDQDGRILSWNKSAEKITGFAPYEVEGRFFHEFCAKEHQASVRRLIAVRNKSMTPLTAEWLLVRRDGNALPISWTCSPMLDEQTNTTGIVAVGRDLTESRKLEDQLLHAQKLAALGVMAGGIAHELRNPLAICSSAAQFLMEPEITPEFRKVSIEKLMTGMQRASSIIDHLLKFARPSARNDFDKLDLVTVLAESVELVANQAKIQNIEVAFSRPDRQIMVYGDSHLLQQVFINLFLNAIYAMPDGGRLNVVAETTDPQVIIRVVDTGCGIPEEDLANIFEPFFAKPQSKKGTGLGLPLCFSIVKQHGGFIEAKSVPGKGSTFTVRLNIIRE